MTSRVLTTAVIVACLSAGSAWAQSTPSLYERESSSQPPANKLPELLTEIGLDQKLNAQVPLELPFKDENRPRRAGSATTSASGR